MHTDPDEPPAFTTADAVVALPSAILRFALHSRIAVGSHPPDPRW
uniref:Uncharacterized protein n=1 Tax=Candidatus Methanogaster sp. ANME-2c ERB4 TaxID=2759911 RepID=A0A7G9YEN6_9EURY|nr:hypothetical protein PAACNKLE_00005 [Methanosarcinales archaeon ANME-2c ERB4]